MSVKRQVLWELLLWGLGFAIVLMVVTGSYVGWQRLHRTDEQVELARYVEMELPSLMESERDVIGRLAPLSSRPGPSADKARALLVDDVTPRLIALRKRANAIVAQTEDVKSLVAGYLEWVDKLIDACRASVRAIDDPALDATAGLADIARKFALADAAAERWTTHVRAACERHHLLAPPAAKK